MDRFIIWGTSSGEGWRLDLEEHMKSISPPKKTDKVGLLVASTFFSSFFYCKVPGLTCLRDVRVYSPFLNLGPPSLVIKI